MTIKKERRRLSVEDKTLVISLVILAVVFVVLAVSAFAFIAYDEYLKHQPMNSNSIIETVGNHDYVVLDHDGVHYVIELGGAEE